jgi:hypothetical protein
MAGAARATGWVGILRGANRRQIVFNESSSNRRQAIVVESSSLFMLFEPFIRLKPVGNRRHLGDDD